MRVRTKPPALAKRGLERGTIDAAREIREFDFHQTATMPAVTDLPANEYDL